MLSPFSVPGDHGSVWSYLLNCPLKQQNPWPRCGSGVFAFLAPVKFQRILTINQYESIWFVSQADSDSFFLRLLLGVSLSTLRRSGMYSQSSCIGRIVRTFPSSTHRYTVDFGRIKIPGADFASTQVVPSDWLSLLIH